MSKPYFNYDNQAVLVTGGTKGIGLAIGLAFGRVGAHVYLTHSWASADEDEIRAKFKAAGAPEPKIIQADASRDEDTALVMSEIKKQHDRVAVFVSNVCAVPIATDLGAVTSRALRRTVEYSVWPLIGYLQACKETFGMVPRYVIGMSSDGVDSYYQSYDFVAVAKATMETLGRYLALELGGQGSCINMIRTRNVITESALTVHGDAYPDFVRKYGTEKHFILAEEVADAVLACCSGLMDAMNGQVLTVDRGTGFADNGMHFYRHREEFGL